LIFFFFLTPQRRKKIQRFAQICFWQEAQIKDGADHPQVVSPTLTIGTGKTGKSEEATKVKRKSEDKQPFFVWLLSTPIYRKAAPATVTC